MTQTPRHSNASGSNLVEIFTRHPVAANLLMVMMILAGLWGLRQLNTQFFPSFNLDIISVSTVWSGATAEDVEASITNPVEQALNGLDGIKNMDSISGDGVSNIILEYEQGFDLAEAEDELRQQVDQVRNLPASAEDVKIRRIVNYETVSRLLLTGDADMAQLRKLAHQFKRELLERGIAKITINGLPEEEIAIQVPTVRLRELGLSLDDVSRRISAASQDVPVGNSGRDEQARQLRFIEQRRSARDFEDLPIISDDNGRLVRLADIASIERRQRSNQTSYALDGKPTISLHLQRSATSDTLKAARILEQWLADARESLPSSVELVVFDEQWSLVNDRISVLLKNGLGGLLLVVLILFLFLSARVAFWVAVGIPVSFMATLAILYLIGGSINMLSLFALIMALGIIVDDAIVVGEHAMSEFQSGASATDAALEGAHRMLAPVASSSLTTIAAFLPLLAVSGIIGTIIGAIPMVVICVIIASLFESFLVLPGHLRHSFESSKSWNPGRFRRGFNAGFDKFTQRVFRPIVSFSVRNRWMSFAAGIGTLLITVGLVAGGHVGFRFFPTPEGSTLFANVSFISGTPRAEVDEYIGEIEKQLYETEKSFDEELIRVATVLHGSTIDPGGRSSSDGDQHAAINVELIGADKRNVRNPDFIQAWRERIPDRPGVENLNIVEPQVGPPGRDVEIQITGSDTVSVKSASLELQEYLATVDGVFAVSDDLPYGREQLVLDISPTGQALGLTVDAVGRQLRSAFDGNTVQIFPEGEDELEVNVMLPDEERNRLGSFDSLSVTTPSGVSVPLANVVNTRSRRGFETVAHADGKLAVTVGASVNPAIANENAVREQISENALPSIANKYGVSFSQEGRAADQSETLGDMRVGAMIALALIYLVLAWVFASYSWPLVVMTVIPFGIVGAIWGHWWMNIDVTILSLFGFFGLSGIVINDSIILVVFFKEQLKKGVPVEDAVIEASCRRLRAVLLTSLTTIAGLTPLLFERSLQAQFLIPMATTIAFGLAFATVLVLIMVPSLLTIREDIAHWLRVLWRIVSLRSLTSEKV